MSYILIGILTTIIALFSPIISLFMPPNETPKEPEIETVTFDGVTYKNYFLEENLFFVEKHNFYTQDPDYTTSIFGMLYPEQGDMYYKVANDWLYKGQKMSGDTNISEKLFCPEEKWDEYKAYYSNAENYNYSYFESNYETSPNDRHITVTDVETFNRLLGDEWDIRDNTQSIVKISDSEEYHTFFLKKVSKDGIFYGKSDKFAVYEGNVYHEGTHIGQYHEIYLYKLENEIETFVAEILKSNGFEAYFD